MAYIDRTSATFNALWHQFERAHTRHSHKFSLNLASILVHVIDYEARACSLLLAHYHRDLSRVIQHHHI